eukprot:scaffold2156_cov115-Cylindrotheca_fusiformis.AAC.22
MNRIRTGSNLLATITSYCRWRTAAAFLVLRPTTRTSTVFAWNFASPPALPAAAVLQQQQGQRQSFQSTTTTTTTTTLFFSSTTAITNSMDEDTTNFSSRIPAPPHPYLSSTSQEGGSLDLSDLDAVLTQSNEQRQQAYDLGNQIKVALVQCRIALENGNSSITSTSTSTSETRLQMLLQQALELVRSSSSSSSDNDDDEQENSTILLRLGNLSNMFAETIRHQTYQHFLRTGTLLPLTATTTNPNLDNDEEYLMGVLSFINFDLKRYVIGRAAQRDVDSVLLARDLVTELLDHLMKYDFRNGNLRRKYDGVKYSLKTCETILYELSVTGASVPSEEPALKKAKVESSSLLPLDELNALHQRMMEKDEIREQLIKKCRDGQKLAKQAIYALHRGEDASSLIQKCEECIVRDLQPLVAQSPQLRHGSSYSNVLEEYAEAKLFQAWLQDGKALGYTNFPHVDSQEYLGGLCDLTGEIGRYAVKQATVRDKASVIRCMETNMSILYALEGLQNLGNIGKKMDPLRRTVEKQERMLYELSLVEATGRTTITAARVDAKEGADNED